MLDIEVNSSLLSIHSDFNGVIDSPVYELGHCSVLQTLPTVTYLLTGTKMFSCLIADGLMVVVVWKTSAT